MIPPKPDNYKRGARVILSPVLVICQILGIIIPYEKKLKLFTFVHRSLVFVILVLIFVHELPSIKYWHDHSEGLHSVMVKLETNCSAALPVPVQAKIFKFNLALILINVFAAVLYNVMGHDLLWRNSNYTPYTSTLYIITEVIVSISAYIFIQIVSLLSEIFKQINSRMRVLKRRIKTGRRCNDESLLERNEIITLRELHLFLSRTCAEVNSCFCIQILFLMFYSMIQILYALRSVVGDFAISDVEESMLNLIVDFVWLLPFLLMLLQLIAFCERTSTEGRRTIIVVHTLMNLYYYDRKSLKELEVFAMQIKQHPIVFSVRFFDLNYPFLNTVVSSLATYFIIIVTFQGETERGVLINWDFKPPTTTELSSTTTTTS